MAIVSIFMEGFEQFVAAAMQSEDPGLVVSSAVKFPVTRRTKKQAYEETQTHGYEADLVGANANQIVLATVKSFFGSRGVVATAVAGTGSSAGLYRLLNDAFIRDEVIKAAAERYGYKPDQVFLRLDVGKFSGKGEATVRAWCAKQRLASGPIEVYNVKEVVQLVKRKAGQTSYIDNASIAALKVLEAAGEIDLPKARKGSEFA
jgi:hypothetical protein